ncbi:MAG: hypothetical protein JW896_09460 [Deltaproteobacteria bacterium]|nr:hypothetical protein [Deltaproteobacteria bacterium]
MKKLMILSSMILLLFLTLSVLTTASAKDQSIAGEWKATWNTAIGTMNCHYTFKADGNILTGKIIAEMNENRTETEIADGKIEGDKITFTWLYNNDVQMVSTGIVAGDEIKISRQVGSYGNEEAVATRIK